ncbi:MAG TPA: NAD(P)-dependent oxidoreductase [Terriglobales bacterium]|nr:NAD(P)-dependent oxidoreductase [Terriglobales bacterium]
MIVDTALRQLAATGHPIRVGMVGAGASGRAIALQLGTPAPGIRLAAIANRTPAHGERAFREAGITDWRRVDTAREAETAIACGLPVLTNDPSVLTACDTIDVLVEVTGTVETAAGVVLEAFEHGKHVVLVNAELDSLLGPILKAKGDQAGVVVTHTDGEEPGVAMTLLRYLRSLGLRPVAAGNLKGMVDYYRTPGTQRAFAEKYDQDARKVTSFADATKLSMEAAILANATGFQVGHRGMYGPACKYVGEMADLLPADQMLATGLVDYALGAAPYTGAFVIVHEDSPLKKAQLAYYKLGDGPFYVFYTPYHLPYVQIASTIGRAFLYRDPTVAPLAGPVCEVVTMAKRDLKAGERLDGVGGFCAYGLIDNATAARAVAALPIGLSEGCTLHRDVSKNDVISFDDVESPCGRVAEALWREQSARWPAVTQALPTQLVQEGPARAIV